ncbi:AraC family transcriptional regulator [Pseudomonas sp. REP124]|uniref:AraC family transcriptional regulator n=1 Tax=Pseudomonas sp. REP124 TaxID=2875731 RepID=UPI001CCD14AC|nr:AraC family transcriptional regulator [Pseudomonas sp. REP124]MBZ9780031.1 AraC family transcriptional regulator [Pseudomonas sp. REP124]
MNTEHTLDRHKDGYRSALIKRIGNRTPGTGDFATAIAGLDLFRRDAPAPPAVCMVPPSIVLVVDGAKKMWVGGEAYAYDSSRFLVTSLDIPANSEVTEASSSHPCLGLAFQLDQRMLAELIAQGGLPPHNERQSGTGVGVGTVTDAILDAFCRLVALLDEPQAIPVLEPMLRREIHYRLLLSDQAEKLRQVAAIDSHGYRVGRAIDWLKVNFASQLRIDELASQVQMSTSSFHRHFRQLTGMSPLQYQKWLRLSEAKRLMLNEHHDASTASFKVGYESPSHFSREYSRMFGLSPKQDITVLRDLASA